ncbi:unnamed protein product, partial [Closterium sp. NIES-53]
GLGSPVFDKLEAELARALMSLPATKGFEIGSGFSGTRMLGSEHNDEFYVAPDGAIRTRTNRSGGIQGGISNGENIVVRVAFKPTSTITRSQRTVTREGVETELKARGRHDPCVVPRGGLRCREVGCGAQRWVAVPRAVWMKAMAALVWLSATCCMPADALHSSPPLLPFSCSHGGSHGGASAGRSAAAAHGSVRPAACSPPLHSLILLFLLLTSAAVPMVEAMVALVLAHQLLQHVAQCDLLTSQVFFPCALVLFSPTHLSPAVPMVEAMVALVLADQLLQHVAQCDLLPAEALAPAAGAAGVTGGNQREATVMEQSAMYSEQ